MPPSPALPAGHTPDRCALPGRRRCLGQLAALALAAGGSGAGAQAAGAIDAAGALPAPVQRALAAAQVPESALGCWVGPVQGAAALLAHRAAEAMNPASVMKLLTTTAALDLLGPGFVWQTPLWLDGPVHDGVLRGDLVLRGSGDPRLLVEHVWLLLRRVMAQGVRSIAGDLVLDGSGFEPPSQEPGQFDGEPLRPYNALPEALLVNFKSVLMHWRPDPAAGVARLSVEPPLATTRWPASVPLSDATCGDWRGALRLDWSQPDRPRFAGAYPAACGERLWPLAHPDAAGFAGQVLAGMWSALGGEIRGRVRPGTAPAGPPTLLWAGTTLAQALADINKFSNNLMAQQLFLTLSLQRNGLGSAEGSRALLAEWWRQRLGEEDLPTIDNGSGLSRSQRIRPRALARLLQSVWASPLMPELAASLPLSGVDGTLRRSRARVGGAHLKTGSLRDVAALAGYVHTPAGQHRVLVALVNHPNAAAARPALDALVDWAGRDG